MSKAMKARRKKMLVGTHNTAERDAWLCGFAAALATMNRLHDRPSFIADVIEAERISGFRIEVAGAEREDIRELRKAYAHRAPADALLRWRGGR